MRFRSLLEDRTRHINWQVVTIPSAVVTQAIAAAGSDAVIIDREHGAVDWGSLHAMIAATKGTDCAPLVRVPSIDEAEVKRCLDLGAEGICFPLLRSAEDARRCLASLRYPPEGTRGWGPFIAHSRWDVGLMDYQAELGELPVSMLLIETREAVETIEEICAVPGIDCIVLAQFDLSVSLGLSGRFDHPDFLAATQKIEAAVLGAGIPLGGVALNQERAKALKAKGYRLSGGFDVLWLKQAVAASRAWGER